MKPKGKQYYKRGKSETSKNIKSLTLTIIDTTGYNEAVVTMGGVDVDEIDPSTMESKIVKGLFFAGEIIDVDSFTGGFNLQIAFQLAISQE